MKNQHRKFGRREVVDLHDLGIGNASHERDKREGEGHTAHRLKQTKKKRRRQGETTGNSE